MAELILFSNKNQANVFRAIGFLVHIVREEDEILEILQGSKDEVKIIAYDPAFESIFNTYKNKQKSLYPLFISLPLSEEDNGKTISLIKENIRKSIGIDLL